MKKKNLDQLLSEGIIRTMTEEGKKKWEIINLQDEREKLWNEMEISYIKKSDTYEIDHNVKINALAEEIIIHLKNNFEILPFDFIIEMLTHLGQAPNLLYDDNGHFAVTGMSMQNVTAEDNPIDVALTAFVEAEEWKDTPREALKHYLFSE